jgi:hypothetical protein
MDDALSGKRSSSPVKDHHITTTAIRHGEQKKNHDKLSL